MGNDNKSSENFQKLMLQLEILTHKCDKNFPCPKNNSNCKLYNNMHIEGLIGEIKISLSNCESQLTKLLNSSSYTPGLIFKSQEIDEFIQNLLKWKSHCPQEKQVYYIRTKQLFDKIQSKDIQMLESQTNQMNIDIEQAEAPAAYNKQFQQQVLVNKQQVIQAQELALLNDNFGRALASLECFANRYSGQIISNVFGYYDMFNLGNTQDLVELQKKAFLQTQIFKLAYEDYVKKYHSYTVPENINIANIKQLVTNWLHYVPKDQKLMYYGMLNIINSTKNNSNFDKKFKSYSEQAKNAKMDPKLIASFAPGVYYYNQQRCDEAKNQYLEEGKIISTLNINQTYKDDTKAVYLGYQIQNNQKNQQEAAFYKDLK